MNLTTNSSNTFFSSDTTRFWSSTLSTAVSLFALFVGHSLNHMNLNYQSTITKSINTVYHLRLHIDGEGFLFFFFCAIPKWTEVATFENNFTRLSCFGKMFRFTETTRKQSLHFFLAQTVLQ